MEREWNNHSEKILKAIAKISGLKWQEKIIKCYFVTGYTTSFSDPLTIKIWAKGKYKTKTKFIDIITHELIHQIFIQNFPQAKRPFFNTIKKYEKEKKFTINHILLHAIHKEIYLTLFSRQRLSNDIRECKRNPQYARAWEIVELESHKKLIQEFKKQLKEVQTKK